MKFRIGIDVGGTFTDAVAVDNETYELIGTVKVPTTHSAAEGVAAGIVQVLYKIMEQCNICPCDVIFVAHGTTQATNALLEGDVADVGIVTVGQGLEGVKSKSDTTVGDLELCPKKFLKTKNFYIEKSSQDIEKTVREAIHTLKQRGCTSFVAAEAFSVDDPKNENRVVGICRQENLPCTATNDISKLYGLKIRTRTAVVNASIMPKMLEAATMTDKSIQNAGILSPLMVMRCDGGVMTVDEVRNRPVLTILSGPAAGVAGVLMYEKLTDGLFFEVGGTSTDISCVKDGKVMIRYAEIGGHKTYLSSLDVHTVGIGGGSMVEIRDGKAVNIGPRSAHIAGLPYEVYEDPENIISPVLVPICPMKGDPEYACIKCESGRHYALTLSGAANIVGFVPDQDYARGSREAALKAWKPLADRMGCTQEDAAQRVLELAAVKNSRVARELLRDYGMDPRTTLFVGGGGGAAAVVPHLAEYMGYKYKIAKNAPVISTIGVALAMVRDMVERTVPNVTENDIISVRREAELRAIQNGAAAGTVEVSVEVDTQKNIVRAIAVGATEMRSGKRLKEILTREQLMTIVAENLDVDVSVLHITAQSKSIFAVQYDKVEKKLMGLIKKVTHPLRLIDEEGIIRLQKNNAWIRQTTVGNWKKDLNRILDDLTEYNDGGTNLPNVYVVLGKKIIDLSGLESAQQVFSLGRVELLGYSAQEPLIIIGSKRLDL